MASDRSKGRRRWAFGAAMGAFQSVTDRTAKYTQGLAQAMNRPASQNLEDPQLLYLLALAAKDSYTLQGDCNGHLGVVFTQFQNSLSQQNNINAVQLGIYEVLKGQHKGKRIMAFRGTDTSDSASALATITQDVSMALHSVSPLGHPIKKTIAVSCYSASEHKPDFITGHSLGGLLAECVCSDTGIGGASFNAPGPIGINKRHSLLPGDRYDGVKFEVHLTKEDPVSLYGGIGGAGVSHIGYPIWHVVENSKGPIDNHSIDNMLKMVTV